MRFWCHMSMFHKCTMGVRHAFKKAYAFLMHFFFFFAPKVPTYSQVLFPRKNQKLLAMEISIFAPNFIYYTHIVIFYCGCFMETESGTVVYINRLHRSKVSGCHSQAMAPCFHKSLCFREEIWLLWPTVAITSHFNTCILNSALWIWAQTNPKPVCYNALSVCCGVYLYIER